MSKKIEAKSITVRLTDARPVTLSTEMWPTIASASWHDGEVSCQATRRARIVVREHCHEEGDDARCIVYGWTESAWGSDRGTAAGYRVRSGADYAEVIVAIRRVGDEIGRDDLARECVQDLPPVDLDDGAE